MVRLASPLGSHHSRRRHSGGTPRVDSNSSATATVIQIDAREASLRKKVRGHLRELGFHKAEDGVLEIDGDGKDVIRTLHRSQRRERLASNSVLIESRTSDLLPFFAAGADLNPAQIKPTLRRVLPGTTEAELFRLASLTWSVPVSNGYGRRLRYLVWDAHHDKLMGLIAIGDPVFNLSVREKHIGWDVREKTARLVNIMDAYVLGALPPYNMLLGGKLVACLVRTREIYDDFTNTYGSATGIISGKHKGARLLAVTTSSSMGRSSVYNRLKLDGTPYLTSLGYTRGWGHFHIPDSLFGELRDSHTVIWTVRACRRTQFLVGERTEPSCCSFGEYLPRATRAVRVKGVVHTRSRIAEHGYSAACLQTTFLRDYRVITNEVLRGAPLRLSCWK